ncbi:hypothetical protein [Streptomyces sp. NPDC056682]|uniref:hypothetical protein n=1 Tax=Streptomyces sp. NPDC056682 TaxID=3345909 RepID=UPI00368ACC95
MPFIRKDKAGSCPGHSWEHDGDVVEVDDVDLVAELLAIPGFSEVAPQPEPEHQAADTPDRGDAAGREEPEAQDTPAAPAKRGRPRKTQTEISE